VVVDEEHPNALGRSLVVNLDALAQKSPSGRREV